MKHTCSCMFLFFAEKLFLIWFVLEIYFSTTCKEILLLRTCEILAEPNKPAELVFWKGQDCIMKST